MVRLAGAGIRLTIAMALLAWALAGLAAMEFVARLGFFGLGVIGTAIWFVAERADMEQDAAVGSAFATDLYARQIVARRRQSRAEAAADRHERRLLQPALVFFKRWGAALAVIGYGGWCWLQL